MYWDAYTNEYTVQRENSNCQDNTEERERERERGRAIKEKSPKKTLGKMSSEAENVQTESVISVDIEWLALNSKDQTVEDGNRAIGVSSW